MTYVIIRILLVGIGAFMAIGYYADALPFRHAIPYAQLKRARGKIAWSIFWTLVVAVGLVGWKPQ